MLVVALHQSHVTLGIGSFVLPQDTQKQPHHTGCPSSVDILMSTIPYFTTVYLPD